jgi:hypothetical protein
MSANIPQKNERAKKKGQKVCGFQKKIVPLHPLYAKIVIITLIFNSK